MKSLITVVAARNEADNISRVVTGARVHGAVVVVDNASTDGTAEIAESSGAVVLRHSEDTHIKQSYIDGFRAALGRGAERVVQLDAGLSFQPEEIPSLLGALETADMAIGSRYLGGSRTVQPFNRRLLSRVGSFAVRLIADMPYSDLTSGFKAYRASLLRTLDGAGVFETIEAKAHGFQFELTYEVYRRGYVIREVPVSYVSTRKRVNLAVVPDALRTLPRLLHRRLTT